MLQIVIINIESFGLHTATYTVTYHESINTHRVHIFIIVFTTGVVISSYLDPGRK